jgi:hypothetical protein
MVASAIPVHQIFHNHHLNVSVNHEGHNSNDQHFEAYQKKCCQIASCSNHFNAILLTCTEYNISSDPVYFYLPADGGPIFPIQFSLKNKAPPVELV